MIRERGFKNTFFDILIYLVLIITFLSCVLPFMHILAVSISGRTAVTADRVNLWPLTVNLDNYGAVATKSRFITSFMISIIRVVIAIPATLVLVALTAYPLALDRIHLPGRGAFISIMIFANMFDIGLIPRYLSYKNLGLIDNFAVLILPALLATFNIIMAINFFRGIPYELVESAMLDGATHLDILFKVMIPLSTPVLATIALFTFVRHWNSWFDGIIYLRNVNLWPLQSYLYSMLTTQQVAGEYAAYRFSGKWPNVSPHGAEAAMIIFAIIPILIIYPILQRYFITGMTLGAVKQ